MVKDNTAQVKQTIHQRGSIFLRMMAETIVMLSTPNTPKKTGRLRMDVVKAVSGLSGKITWGKNYAIYQEKKQFANYTTPGTGPHYAENAVKQAVGKTSNVAASVGLA